MFLQNCDSMCDAGDAAAGPGALLRGSDSFKGSAAAREERYDALEARGYGAYSLHAVLGQGSFGRIHLASWRKEGDHPASLAGGSDNPSGEVGPGYRARLGGADYSSINGGEISCSAVTPGLRGADGGRPGGRRQRPPAGGGGGVVVRDSGSSGGSAGVDYAGGRRRFSLDERRRCDGGCVMEEEGWGWDGRERALEPRLRALKSVCKRKLTEKGLVRHMETVSGRAFCRAKGCLYPV